MSDIEQAAARLRRQLPAAQLPELKLLCGLRFFSHLRSHHDAVIESYLREFTPILSDAATKSNPHEFLPDETASLEQLSELLQAQPDGVIALDDLNALERLVAAIKSRQTPSADTTTALRRAVVVNCLFVEYYPDLDLPPRGRLLQLYVSGSPISPRAEADDIVVRNPVDEPDDRFLAQARDSIKAARAHVLARFGLPFGKRYRFDFAVNSSGARFTGDSLGLAFAVGAVAALAKIEVFRDKLSVADSVAFSGALSPEGRLEKVDSEALKLKIYRAFHSDLKLLVIPREHITDAWTYLSTLEGQHENRRLELVGADALDTVAGDPRLLRAERSSAPVYWVRKIWRIKRSVWVEIPALILLLAVLAYLVTPERYLPWFDNNPVFAISNPGTNSLEAYNRDSTLLWADVLSCPISKVTSEAIWSSSFGRPYDFDGDGLNEVVFLPQIDEICDDRAFLRFYSHDGQLLWKRNAALLGRYPKDTAGVQYDAGFLRTVETSTGPVIVSIVNQEMPARSHIRLWNPTGDPRGWYIHWGHGMIQKTVDVDLDGAEEILFTGFNNRNHCVGLLVLKPDSVQGFSPIEPGVENEYSWWVPGTQAAYILFPMSDVGRVPGELPVGYNAPGPNGVRLADDGQIQVYVSESVNYESRSQLIYTIDHRFRVVKVVMNDFLVTHRRQLVAEGKLPPIEDARAYFATLRDAVTYWTNSGWVTEGQMRAAEGLK